MQFIRSRSGAYMEAAGSAREWQAVRAQNFRGGTACHSNPELGNSRVSGRNRGAAPPYPNHWRCVSSPGWTWTGAELEATLWDGRPGTRARGANMGRPSVRPSVAFPSHVTASLAPRSRFFTPSRGGNARSGCETVGGRKVRSTAVGVECY
jgi:hypothetical protein